MALDVLEWGVIIVMGASILIWGPEKVPEIAKTLAGAKKQFDGATKQLQGITKELQTGINGGNLNLDSISNAIMGAGNAAGAVLNTAAGDAKATPGAPPAVAPSGLATGATTAAEPAPLPGTPKKSADQMLIDMAKSLRISTQGMTREEISKAIMDVVAARPVQTLPAQGSSPEAAPKESPPVAPVEAPAPVEAEKTEVQTDAPAPQ